MRRHLSLLLALALCLGLLAGCGSEPSVDYPELAAVDTSAMELESAENSSLKASFPKADWVAEPNTDPLSVYYQETASSDQAVNINAQISSSWKGSLSESDKDDLVDSIAEEGPFMNITEAKVLSLNGSPVIYMEETLSFTDETVDWMLDNGAWTEAWLEQMGGREAITAIPDTDQLLLYVVVDGQLCLYTGTYYAAEQKALVLEAMTTMAQTTEILR